MKLGALALILCLAIPGLSVAQADEGDLVGEPAEAGYDASDQGGSDQQGATQANEAAPADGATFRGFDQSATIEAPPCADGGAVPQTPGLENEGNPGGYAYQDGNGCNMVTMSNGGL